MTTPFLRRTAAAALLVAVSTLWVHDRDVHYLDVVLLVDRDVDAHVGAVIHRLPVGTPCASLCSRPAKHRVYLRL